MTQLLDQLAALHADGPETAIDAIPYARHLDLRARLTGEGLVLRMPYHPQLIGMPVPPRLHGGAVCGLLEVTCALTAALARGAVPEGASPFPKPVNITIDYLRAGAVRDVFALARIARLGRTITNVRAECWQEDRNKLMATAHMNLLMA